MSQVKENASRAKRLLNDPAFIELLADMEARACALFSDPFCDRERMWEAHADIRAVHRVKAEMQSRIDAGLIEQKREDQHRYDD